MARDRDTPADERNDHIEACARIAEGSTANPASPFGQRHGADFTNGFNMACEQIARSIRSLKR